MSDRIGGTSVSEETHKPGVDRRLVLTLGVVAVLLAAVVGALALVGPEGGAGRKAAPASTDPSATLEAALADGRPAYVLIHSLT